MPPAPVVHLVAKTHLDLGFTALGAEVAQRYVDDFFPRALAVAAELRDRGGAERLVWTTGSWVLHHALHEGSAAQRNAVAAGVRTGALAWHALPLTTHTEVMDADLVRAGLAISQELDARFGRSTTAAKMTDVPGHTRGLVPLLAEAGVRLLHLGVNPAWPVPDVPPVFRWRAPDGTEVVVAYQAGGYGGEVAVAGCGDVLAFLHTGDNLGPPTVDEVLDAHASLAARHEGAEVRGSTLDAFDAALVASGAAARLPVVTAEIGDPWVFGTAADPVKLAAYRALLRARRALACDAEGRRVPGTRGPGASGPVARRVAARRVEVDRQLMLVAEHTWGLDQKEALPDVRRWDRAGLAELRATPEGERFERSWQEQRDHVDAAAAVLADARATLGVPEPAGAPRRVADHLGAVPRWPVDAEGTPLGGFAALQAGRVVGGAGWELGLDPATGALAHLVHGGSGRTLADPAHLVGRLGYQSFSEADYERFHRGLTPTATDEWWSRLDNTKPGIDAAGARSAWWDPTVVGAWHAQQRAGTWHTVLVRLAFPGAPADVLGAPTEVWARWAWHEGSDELDLDVWWPDKPASRLPEATWCSFTPMVAEPDRWTLDKLGQDVSPLDVVRHGGRGLHGVGEGMAYAGPDGSLRIRTVDAGLVAPGRPALLEADPPLPDLAGGLHVLLHDNCWGTNFPMWSEGPARFRFTLAVGPAPSPNGAREVSRPRS